MQIIAEISGADIQMEHATIKAGAVKHVEEQRIPRTNELGLLIEVEGGQIWFKDMPEGLAEALEEAFGKWGDQRDA